jgi:hypothetical protein
MTERQQRRSNIEAFGCPFRYQKIILEGVDDTGDEAVRGRAFHAAAMIYVLRLAAKGLTADHEEAQLALKEGLAISPVPHHLIHHVEKLFMGWARHFELDLDAFMEAEELGGTSRSFRPDLVYARPFELEMKDWKTYYKGLTETQARQELQLRWYLIEAVKKWPGFKAYRFTFVFVRLGYEVSLVFTPDEIAEFEAGVQGSIDAVAAAEAAGAFPAMPGSHCSLCRLACPIVDNPHRAPIRVTTRQEAEDAAGQILALEQRLKILKKSVNGWCAVEGPLLVRGQEFAHRERVSVRYPLDRVLEHIDASQHGQLSISTTGLKTIWRKAAQIPAALQAFALAKQTWPFTHKKAGEVKPDDVGRTDVLAEDDTDADEAD